MKKRFLQVLTILAACAATVASAAKPAGVFNDNMVLQRGMPAPIWGKARPGEKITVEFAGQKCETTTAPSGDWMVKLAPLQASSTPRDMTIRPTKPMPPVVIKNVLVGEVWFCSGQSNMALHLRNCENAKEESAQANWPLIRYSDNTIKWQVCSPANVSSFSGTAYFFGRLLFKELNVPIGLINRSAGGTAIEWWIPEKDALAIPYVENMSRECERPEVFKEVADYPANRKTYVSAMKAWQEARKKGDKTSPPPAKLKPPEYQIEMETYGKKMGRLFQAMVKPVIPYAIKGIIWYQGERNSRFKGGSYAYRDMLPALIKSWRREWGEGDIPFLYVQLPNYCLKSWPLIRESMLKCLKVKNTAMAVTIDIGDKGNIHPRNKQDVGKRLGLLALKKAYGKNIVAESPLFDSMNIKGDSAILSFKNVDGGLVAKKTLLPKITPLGGFEIAGKDKVFHPAQAKIEGDKVIVSSAKVTEPVAVRYAWASNPVCDLYNKEGLPASPFRTDTWEIDQ